MCVCVRARAHKYMCVHSSVSIQLCMAWSACVCVLPCMLCAHFTPSNHEISGLGYSAHGILHLLCLQSGTTGSPNGVMLSHDNVSMMSKGVSLLYSTRSCVFNLPVLFVSYNIGSGSVCQLPDFASA